MKIDKAIEIVGDIIRYEHSASHSDKGDALKLGIEALKRLRAWRHVPHSVGFYPLPGETKE